LADLIEELTGRLQAGEPIDLKACLHEHPEHADHLRDLLPALQALAGAAPASEQWPNDAVILSAAEGLDGREMEILRCARNDKGQTSEVIKTLEISGTGPLPRGVLGDFRILREIGRGGMGVVYEAEQISLSRRVALKVLPFAAALDTRQLQRFKTEAQAAAQLHHSNIVPVFAVGCEQGTHYYAMQYIEGQTLADVIQEFTQQTGRRKAAGKNRGSRIEDRMSMGNNRGTTIEERSPGTDTFSGHPRSSILDPQSSFLNPKSSFFATVAKLGVQAAEALEYAHQFGVVHRDIKPANLLVDVRGNLWITDFGLARYNTDAGLTGTGDLLGTLRYMSPEQATGKRGTVDHRADIYALGVTLYELLTLRPAFDGQSREEVLAQIAVEEPVPPRRINQAIPIDLETIILKSLAKRSEERYASAQELADDLQRFLEERPIQAKRPTLLEKANKWRRRHKTLMRAGLVMMALGFLGLLFHMLVVTRQRNEIEARRRQACDAVDAMYSEFAEKWLSRQPHLEQVQRDFLVKALQFYEEFAKESGSSPELRLETGKAYRRVGDIQYKLGRHEKAEEAYDQAVGHLEKLADDFPSAPEYQHELALARNNRGNLLRDLGRLADAEQTYRQAQELWDKLIEEFPDNTEFQDSRAGNGTNLGFILAGLNRPAEAEQAYHQALEVLEKLTADLPDEAIYRHDLAACLNNLGNLLTTTCRLKEAEGVYRRALVLWERLARDYPSFPAFRRTVAVTAANLGVLEALMGRPADAEKKYRRSLAIQESLASEYAATVAYRQEWAASLTSLGHLLAGIGKEADAEEAYHQALSIREELAADFPAIPAFRRELAASQHSWGRLLFMTGKLKEAERACRQALTLRQKLQADFPDVAAYRNDLGESWHFLGNLLATLGRLAEANQAYLQALTLEEPLSAPTPKGYCPWAYRFESNSCRQDLGILLGCMGRTHEARSVFRAVIAAQQKLAADYPEMAHFRFQQAAGLSHWASLQMRLGRVREAEQALRRSIALGEKVACCGNPDHRRILADNELHLGELLALLGRSAESEKAFARALSLQASLADDFPKVPAYRRQLAEGLYRLGQCLVQSGRRPQAEKAFRQALALRKSLVADFPVVPGYFQELAWLLATCPDLQFRDADLAVQMAGKAVDLAPECGTFWLTLGVAKYRSGDGKAALATLKKGLDLRQGGEAADWFFLAMASRQQGEERDARQWLAKAVAWMDQYQPADLELRTFRAEAEEEIAKRRLESGLVPVSPVRHFPVSHLPAGVP
jgi:serine/threonine protein kinase/Flp pilus assembly protein TadD